MEKLKNPGISSNESVWLQEPAEAELQVRASTAWRQGLPGARTMCFRWVEEALHGKPQQHEISNMYLLHLCYPRMRINPDREACFWQVWCLRTEAHTLIYICTGGLKWM